MELNLLRLLRILRRRWWIFGLIAIFAASSAYFTVQRETPLYQATAVMVVNPAALVGSNDQNSLQDSQRLTETYTMLVNTQPMRERVAAAVGIDEIDPGSISVNTVGNTLLIEITVTDVFPEDAADIANAFVSEFQNYIRDQNDSRVEQSLTSVEQQVDFLNMQIEEVDEELLTADTSEIEGLQQQRRVYLELVAQLESEAATSSMRASSGSPFIQGVDPAEIPGSPSSPQVMQTTMLGAVVGLLIGTALVALLEYLDNTVKTYADIEEVVAAPLLASIPILPSLRRDPKQIFVSTQPRSNQSESIRLLRTNLTFASVESPLSTLVVTSTLPGEGKSTVAANLAMSIAQSGKLVALLDGDLRKPTLHTIFNVDNVIGTTTFITDSNLRWDSVAINVSEPRLKVITSGPLPPNPGEIISSDRFRELIHQLTEEFDLVVIDSPPVLGASDALVSGSIADGVLLVTQHGRTRIEEVRNASDLISQSGAWLVGVIINKTKGAVAGGFGGYYHSDEY